MTTADIETQIVDRVWKTVWDNMTPEQRVAFNQRLVQESKKWGKSAATATVSALGGGMLLAQTSGFGIYLLASSTLGALTSGLGLTLPFAVYTAVSSAISIVIGPIGWIGLGLLAAHKLTGPDYNRLTSAVVMVHCIRARIRWEEEQRQRNRTAFRRRIFLWAVTVVASLMIIRCWFLS